MQDIDIGRSEHAQWVQQLQDISAGSSHDLMYRVLDLETNNAYCNHELFVFKRRLAASEIYKFGNYCRLPAVISEGIAIFEYLGIFNPESGRLVKEELVMYTPEDYRDIAALFNNPVTEEMLNKLKNEQRTIRYKTYMGTEVTNPGDTAGTIRYALNRMGSPHVLSADKVN